MDGFYQRWSETSWNSPKTGADFRFGLVFLDAFRHIHFYTNTFTRRDCYTQTLLHTDAFTHRRFYTQTLLHRDFYAFTHRHFTQTHSHGETVTHRSFYTQTLLPDIYILVVLTIEKWDQHEQQHRIQIFGRQQQRRDVLKFSVFHISLLVETLFRPLEIYGWHFLIFLYPIACTLRQSQVAIGNPMWPMYMKFLMGQSSINVEFSIATFDYRRVNIIYPLKIH